MSEQPIQTIRNQVYQIIRESLWKGEYAYGQRLQEVELASRLNVSRSPVREALHQLVADGLAIEVPNKGVFVKTFTPDIIDEIFDVRILLESYAIGHARQNMTDADQSGLYELLDEMKRSCRISDMDAYIAADCALHKTIIRLGGNHLVSELYGRVHAMNQQFRIMSLSSQNRFEKSMEEHEKLIQALIAGEVDWALTINTRHLELACATIKKRMTDAT